MFAVTAEIELKSYQITVVKGASVRIDVSILTEKNVILPRFNEEVLGCKFQNVLDFHVYPVTTSTAFCLPVYVPLWLLDSV